MRKHIPVRLIVLSLMLIVSALFAVLPGKVTHAEAPSLSQPSWWLDGSGHYNDCDAYHFNAGEASQGSTSTAHLLLSWNGLEVCGYGPEQTDPNTGNHPYDVAVQFPHETGPYENEWECTELVKRYLYIGYGANALTGTYGYNLVSQYLSNYSSLFASVPIDGSAHVYPQPGDVLSYNEVGTPLPGDGGHTAIVESVSGESGGSATVQLIEQNASLTGTTPQTFSNWQFQNGIDNNSNDTGHTVDGWLTPKESWSNVSPSGTAQIYSMAAASTTSVWAAGRDGGSNPVTYLSLSNGSGWTKYTAPAQCICNHYLYGIASIPASGGTWTVGAYTPSNLRTLAYHWNGTSWVHVTSDNPASSGYSNYLYGVAVDSSGGAWAAGKYWISGVGYQPLIEKWNSGTSNFDKQTISLPSGQTTGNLYSIAFSSSTNGWAVGDASGSTISSWVIYHWDGSNWTSTLGSTSWASLKSVAIVSDSEVWAVGQQGSPAKPLILHGTYANSTWTWTEDTSFNGSYPSYTYLYGVGTDGPHDVWVVGQYGGGPWHPYSMHFNGASWVQVSTPSVSSNSYLNSVAVNSGDAWAGGYIGDSNWTPLVFQYS